MSNPNFLIAPSFSGCAPLSLSEEPSKQREAQ
jgi:hypothetical protein